MLDRQALTRLPTTPAAKRRRNIALGAGATGTQGPRPHSPTGPKGASDSHRRKYRSPYSISYSASSDRNSSCNHTRRWCWFAICSIALSGLPVCCQLFLGFRRGRLHPRLTSNAASRLIRMARPPSTHRCRLWVSPTPQPASHLGSVHVLPSHTHRTPTTQAARQRATTALREPRDRIGCQLGLAAKRRPDASPALAARPHRMPAWVSREVASDVSAGLAAKPASDASLG